MVQALANAMKRWPPLPLVSLTHIGLAPMPALQQITLAENDFPAAGVTCQALGQTPSFTRRGALGALWGSSTEFYQPRVAG